MKALISVIFLFSFESFGQTLTSGQRVSTSDTSRVTISNPTQLTNGTQNGSGTQGQNSTGPQGQNLNSTGGFEATPVGALTHANAAASSGNATQILGLAVGAGFARICAQPYQQWACPVAARAFMDALSAGRARDNALNTAHYLDPNLDPNTNPNLNGENPMNQQAIDGINQMSSLGYTVNPDGSVTTPQGENLTAADMMTAEGLASKGFSPQQVQDILGKINETQNAALQKSGIDPESLTGQAVASSGGGSGGAIGSGSDASLPTSGTEWVDIEEIRGGKKAPKENRMPASQAAKLSKNFNGSPIGIGLADIFLIVQQKYDEKKQKKTEFINREY